MFCLACCKAVKLADQTKQPTRVCNTIVFAKKQAKRPYQITKYFQIDR